MSASPDIDRSQLAERRTVVAAFDEPGHAERALTQLRALGFEPQRISVIARDRQEAAAVAEHTSVEAQGTATGVALGGLTGGVLGWLVGVGALAIPGLGAVAAAGALAAALSGAAIGAGAGGLVGALIDTGVAEAEAREYEQHVREGRLLLTIDAASDEQAQAARDALERAGGLDVRVFLVSNEGAGPALPGE